MYRAFSDVEGNLMKSLEETYNQSIRASQNIVENIRFSRKLYLESVDSCSMQICNFKKHDTNYYCGREVRLSNERTGNIVSINPEKISKPLVRCDDDHCDLAESDLEIVEFF